jgi:Type II secretion system (T2SS), protein E, N-terminal domain
MPVETLPAIDTSITVPGTETEHGRRFGELLVEEALITREQLQEALRVQGSLCNYLPLGQVLLNQGWLTRRQLTTVLRRHGKSARLGELLVRTGHITPEKLQTALADQQEVRQPLGQTLRALGYVTEEMVREALCAQLHVNFFDLDRIDTDHALVKLVNEKYAIKRRIVPLFRVDQVMVLAVDDPTDVGMIEELQLLLRMRIEIVTSTLARIGRATKRLYGAGPRPAPDPTRHDSILVGNVRDQEVVDLAMKALRVQILPPA